MSENRDNQSMNQQVGEGQQHTSSPLRETMQRIMDEKSGSTNQNYQSQIQQSDQQSQIPQSQSDPDDMIFKNLEDLMQTDWFKSLPAEQKELIRSGVNPLLDELDRAVIQQQLDAIKEINRVRREYEGKPEITHEQYKSGEYMEDTEDTQGEDDEFIKMMKDFTGTGTAAEEDDEEAQDKLFRELERRFEEAVDVELQGATKEFDTSSAALQVEIKRNKSYEESLKNILDGNNVKIKTTKKGNLKKAALKAYTQRHDHVTTPLVNSGFYITLSGASIPEIIAIASIESPKSLLELEFKKLGVIKKHLVDTSFGNNVNLQDLMKIIHYKDEQTLYYNLFIATFPDINDYPATCINEKCKQELNIKIHSADLVLNPEEFKDRSDTILYKNVDIKDVMKQTKISKIKEITLSDYTIIGIRIPSLYDRLNTMSRIEQWVNKSGKDTTNLNVVFGYLMFIDYIAIPTENGEYIKYDSRDIDDIIEILISMDQELHNEIDDQIEEYDDSKEVMYGIKPYICPTCKQEHKQQILKMDDLLFTLSQVKGMRNNLNRWKKRKDKNS